MWLPLLHTHPARTHTYTQFTRTHIQILPRIRLFVKLTEKHHRRYRCHPIRCQPRAPPLTSHASCRLISRLCADEEANNNKHAVAPKAKCLLSISMCVSVSVSAIACHCCLLSDPFALSLFLCGTHSLSALQAALSAANCVCFIDFHSPTSFHSFLTILLRRSPRGVNKNGNRFYHFIILRKHLTISIILLTCFCYY